MKDLTFLQQRLCGWLMMMVDSNECDKSVEERNQWEEYLEYRRKHLEDQKKKIAEVKEEPKGPPMWKLLK
jgi:hypothetical protein